MSTLDNTNDNPVHAGADEQIQHHTLQRPRVEDQRPESDHTPSKGSAASVSEVNKTTSSHILKIERTIGGVKINVRIFQEPTPTPASPEEAVPNPSK